jgi:hypothetical protein
VTRAQVVAPVERVEPFDQAVDLRDHRPERWLKPQTGRQSAGFPALRE